MSKNVAVFVDVANIFYAAKAAGIDIDYVTLLKSATAGRDFVRAYAYTGLDPENENQRQFHSFLARNGYKVISKDIRKYGDGRIKANLDIELVVDMMKTARNLDIAVVVSGDGDFAPAIRAVQEQGVRVEVISFRGNTSSDLIEVADLFTDIAQIARVEKSSARSGRRVAAEGDLSMTEVPEKETEGAPRRRRGRPRDERPAEVEAPLVAAAATGRQANMVVLPGERLSRRADGEEAIADGDADLEVVAALVEVADGDGADFEGSENGDATADGQRRRRRRGGRGRGRGRRSDAEGTVPADGVAVAAGPDDEDEEFEDLAPAQPAHQTFGSVWDSQIGVPSSTAGPGSSSNADGDYGHDEDLDEPEVPEYLLAERRQGGQRQGSRGGGGGVRSPRSRSAYQAALDRERYGTRPPPSSQPSYGGNSSSGGSGGSGGRSDGNRSSNRGRDGNRGGRPQYSGSRPVDRGPRTDDRPVRSEPRSAEPWSEVPPEVEEMLRAEMARKSAPTESRVTERPTSAPSVASPSPAFSASTDAQPAAPMEKPARRPRTTKASTATATADSANAESMGAAAAAAAPKPRTRSTTAKPTTAKPTTAKSTTAKSTTAKSTAAKSTKAAATSEPAADAAEATAKKPATRRRTTTKAPAEEG